jgi:hypothetical protein
MRLLPAFRCVASAALLALSLAGLPAHAADQAAPPLKGLRVLLCEPYYDLLALPVVRRLRAATSRRLFAAGGVTTRREIALLEAIDVDAVVGMAIYTSTLDGDPV